MSRLLLAALITLIAFNFHAHAKGGAAGGHAGGGAHFSGGGARFSESAGRTSSHFSEEGSHPTEVEAEYRPVRMVYVFAHGSDRGRECTVYARDGAGCSGPDEELRDCKDNPQ